MIWDHVILNGNIVTPHETFKANLYIKDEKIAAITADELEGEAREVTDARGKFVMPGFIDTHSHSRDGRNGAHYKEDFFHSSMAGACGGITTILEMPNCNPAIYNVNMLDDLVEVITPKAHVDFGVWGLCLGNLNNSDIRPLNDAGVVGFKFFWGYAIDAASYQLIYNYKEGMKDVIPPLDEGEIFKIFRHVKETGKMMAIHAESFDIIKLLTEEALASGDKGYEGSLRARPPMSELIIIDTAIEMARHLGAHLHILHLASGDAVEHIRRAQKEGVHVTAETCPHYLAMTNEDYDRVGPLMKGYPPVRTSRDQALLWQGLNEGVLNHVCSDHAPHSPEEKAKGLWEAPAGMTNIEIMAPVMLTAVNEGKMTINKLVEVLSTNPAKLFNLYPRKGSLQVGTDADVVVVDMNCEYILDQTKLHSRTKLTPFNGFTMKGKPVKTILRGHTIAENGEKVCDPIGTFLKVE